MMYQIAVASANPVKLQATETAFSQLLKTGSLEIIPANVPSGVADQPFGDEETLLGARNRIRAIRSLHAQADYWVGIEGGVGKRADTLEAFAWVVVGRGTATYSARTASFLLPPRIRELIEAGHELGVANDMVFGTHNSKQQAGAVGLLTDNLIDRTSLYVPAVVLAATPFLRPDLFSARSE